MYKGFVIDTIWLIFVGSFLCFVSVGFMLYVYYAVTIQDYLGAILFFSFTVILCSLVAHVLKDWLDELYLVKLTVTKELPCLECDNDWEFLCKECIKTNGKMR